VNTNTIADIEDRKECAVTVLSETFKWHYE